VRNHRTALFGLATAAVLAVAGCTTSGGASSSPSSTAPVDGHAALVAALAKIGSTSSDVTITQHGLNGTGSFDPSAMTAQIELKGVEQGVNVDIQALQAGGQLYAKFDAGAAADAQLGIDQTKWMLVDQSKLTGPNAKPFDLSSPDTLDIAGMLAGVNAVQATDATHLSGTVDLSKATGINVPSASDLSTAGAAAKTTPFTVVLDDQGRIVDLKVDADGFDKSLTFEIGFADFGSARPVTAPAASDIVPAPAGLYTLLNG